ncbi:hypothetical protein AVEN_229440-1 [Araneus ventricosus]|uniref:Uncharacterized protein n=1 Tax=Araneus ventricosus TaxID=182803 RepID=A0A4Y2I5Q5_ARAVE|nr:hypothetical protein AVEN_229440-1 [Araneus ventricosus]
MLERPKHLFKEKTVGDPKRPNINWKIPPPFVKCDCLHTCTPAARAFFVRVARPDRFVFRNEWFEHDCAPAHKTSSVKQYLVEEFVEQIIGYGGFQEWPSRLPDLTPMDFFLWGYLKQQVYTTPPPIFQDL